MNINDDQRAKRDARHFGQLSAHVFDDLINLQVGFAQVHGQRPALDGLGRDICVH